MSGVQMSLDARRRNLSDSQLHAVPSAVRRYVHPSGSGQLRDGLQRKLTAPDIRHPTSGIRQCLVIIRLFKQMTITQQAATQDSTDWHAGQNNKA